MKKALPIIVILVLIAIVFIGIGISRKGKRGGQRQIAVIPKGITHIFWESIRRGAEKAGAEADVKIFWNGPEREGNREMQIQIIEDFITRKVSGIVLAPIDNKAMVPSVEKIYAKSIPCVIIDSGIDTDKYVSFVATDNYKGGVIAARRMGKILSGKGRIVVVKYAPGSASTMKREDGFINTIEKDFPEIEIVDSKYGLDTVETSLQAAEDLLTKNTELDGIFACNESTSVGTLRALQSQRRAGKMKMIGFDAGGLLIEGVKAGIVDSLVVQNPYKMGYEGVRVLIATLDGKKVERRVDTGVMLVTKENLETPEIRELLKGMF
jgi:ribose transport system substrate-binding protein